MGRNNADFQGITISHKIEKPSSITPVEVEPDYVPTRHDRIWIEANHPTEGKIGKLYLVRPNNEERVVGDIDVHPNFQRRGIATAMWNYAKAQGFNPKHSPQRTPEGTAWAKSTGEPLPEYYSGFN